MAIMAEFPFIAEFDTITSDEALKNPFDKRVTMGGDFLAADFMVGTITDMHFFQRDRFGRTITFLARKVESNGHFNYAIACDEMTSMVVDLNGIGTVVVDKVLKDTGFKCYIIEPTVKPSVLKPNTPLTFEQIKITRLSNQQQYDLRNRKKINGDVYMINASNGKLFSSGNGGQIY